MIATFPSQSRFGLSEYTAAIARQVLELLRLDRKPHNAQYIRAAGVIMSKWLERHPAGARVHFIVPITAPLRAFFEPVTRVSGGSSSRDGVNNIVDEGLASVGDTPHARVVPHTNVPDSDDEEDHDNVNRDNDNCEDDDEQGGPEVRRKHQRHQSSLALVSEDAIDRCLSDLHALFVTSDPTASQLLPMLRPVALPLLRMHAVAQRTLSHQRRPIEEVLCAYFALLPERDAAAEFCRILLPLVVDSDGVANIDVGGGGSGSDDGHDDGPVVMTQLDGTLVVRGLEPRYARVIVLKYCLLSFKYLTH